MTRVQSFFVACLRHALLDDTQSLKVGKDLKLKDAQLESGQWA